MAEARQQAEWQRVSALMALLANVNRDPKHAPFKPADFNPYAKSASESVVTVNKEEAILLFKQIAQAARR